MNCQSALLIGDAYMLFLLLQMTKILGEAPSLQEVKMDAAGKGADLARARASSSDSADEAGRKTGVPHHCERAYIRREGCEGER